MNRIQQALTRKVGPFPAWAWAAIVGVAIFVLRNRLGAGGGGDGGGTSPADTLSYYGPYGDALAPVEGGSFGGTGNPTGGPPVVNIYPPGHHKTKHHKHKHKKTKKPKPHHKPKTHHTHDHRKHKTHHTRKRSDVHTQHPRPRPGYAPIASSPVRHRIPPPSNTALKGAKGR